MERDVAKFWQPGNIRLAYIGLENQTNIHRFMPLRVIGYDGIVYRDALNKAESSDKEISITDLYPVITIVLYFGYEHHWSAPLNLKNCFDIPKRFEPYISDYKINLFEIAWLPDETIQKFKSDFRFVADYFSQMCKTKQWQPMPGEVKHVKELFELFAALTDDNRFLDIFKESNGGGLNNMSSIALDKIENRGFLKGKSQGVEETTIRVVINMLKKNYPHKTIAELAEISTDDVIRIAKKIGLSYN